MKREADGDMGSPQKRSRRGDEEVRLLIPSKVAGSIIGKGGQNITKLRSQYKASITVPDCPGPERMLTLSSDLDTICNIVSDVVPNLEENGGRTSMNELDLRMMVHQSQAGCVIGKAGYKIKELREKTGARIKIFSNMAPQSTDRVVQIVGDASKCIDSIREIVTLIKSNPIKGIVNPYDPHNFDDYYAEEYGGWGSSGSDRRGGGGSGGGGLGSGGGGPRGGGGSGSGGSGGRNNGFRDGPSRFNSRSGGSAPPRGGGGSSMSFSDRSMGGGGQQRSSGAFGGGSGGTRISPFEKNGWSSNDSSMLSSPPNIMSTGSLGPAFGGPGLGGQNGGGGGGGGNKNTTQVTIPKDLAGAIIGKGGGRIRKIRQDSGAGITIDEPLPGSNDRIITITGSSNEIQMAQYLLQESVRNNTGNNY